MVNYSSPTLDATLHALADPTRRKLLARIAAGECTVTELAEPHDMSLAAISKHLRVLEDARFVEKVKSGRTVVCRARLSPLDEVGALLEDLGRYWNRQFDSLERFLEQQEPAKGERMQAKKNEQAPALIVRRTVRARRDRVFRAWTDPDQLKVWLHPMGGTCTTSNELKVGGSYHHEMHFEAGQLGGPCETSAATGASVMHQGTYLEIVPPERLVFTWSSPSVTDSRVTVQLFERGADGEQTEVVVTHELLDTPELQRSHSEGWNGCLDNLERTLAY